MLSTEDNDEQSEAGDTDDVVINSVSKLDELSVQQDSSLVTFVASSRTKGGCEVSRAKVGGEPEDGEDEWNHLRFPDDD